MHAQYIYWTCSLMFRGGHDDAAIRQSTYKKEQYPSFPKNPRRRRLYFFWWMKFTKLNGNGILDFCEGAPPGFLPYYCPLVLGVWCGEFSYTKKLLSSFLSSSLPVCCCLSCIIKQVCECSGVCVNNATLCAVL